MKSHKLAFLTAVLLLLLPLGSTAADLAKVVRVIDGDTIELETGEKAPRRHER